MYRFTTTSSTKLSAVSCQYLFKFEEGSWHECRKAIEAMHKEDFPNAYLRLFNEEEEYDKYLRSESALMKLLTFVSLVCILISLFGIFSLVTLSCEQRRKEIAIRRVNGAQVYHILHLFSVSIYCCWQQLL